MAALAALEQQSREFIKEREEKKKLEEMIGELESQVMMGGARQYEDPEGMKEEYDKKMSDLEKDREKLEEDRA